MIPSKFKIKLKVEAFEPCPKHAPLPCDCPKVKTGEYCNDYDLATAQFAQFIMVNIFANAQTIKNLAGGNISVGANSAVSAPLIIAGIGTTGATVTDTNLQTATAGSSGSIAATINAYSGSGGSGSFTITGTITNTSGSTVNYSEVGLQITAAANNFLLSHDIFAALGVSNNGTLTVTYNVTLS